MKTIKQQFEDFVKSKGIHSGQIFSFEELYEAFTQGYSNGKSDGTVVTVAPNPVYPYPYPYTPPSYPKPRPGIGDWPSEDYPQIID